MATSKNNNQRFITSLRDEPKKMLLPIEGYEDEIVKSIDDACQPIKHLFDEKLNTYVTIAKTNSMSPEDGLTPDESASIQLYTFEWPIHEKSLYMLLNNTLRATDRNKLKPWFKYLKLVLTAFYKLPPSEHTLLWRGVREDLSSLYPKGKEFTWWAFSSCTASMSVLESDNYLGKSGSRTVFSIQTNNGKSIAAHSYFENEDEFLLPPGIYLKVIDVLSPADDLHIIQIREIPAPYKMIAEPFDLTKIKKSLPEVKPPSVPIEPPIKPPSVQIEPPIKPPSVQIEPPIKPPLVPIVPPIKPEISHASSVTPKPLIKQESYLTPSATPKPSVQVAEKTEKPSVTVSGTKISDSKNKLDIHNLFRM